MPVLDKTRGLAIQRRRLTGCNGKVVHLVASLVLIRSLPLHIVASWIRICQLQLGAAPLSSKFDMIEQTRCPFVLAYRLQLRVLALSDGEYLSSHTLWLFNPMTWQQSLKSHIVGLTGHYRSFSHRWRPPMINYQSPMTTLSLSPFAPDIPMRKHKLIWFYSLA